MSSTHVYEIINFIALFSAKCQVTFFAGSAGNLRDAAAQLNSTLWEAQGGWSPLPTFEPNENRVSVEELWVEVTVTSRGAASAGLRFACILPPTVTPADRGGFPRTTKDSNPTKETMP